MSDFLETSSLILIILILLVVGIFSYVLYRSSTPEFKMKVREEQHRELWLLQEFDRTYTTCMNSGKDNLIKLLCAQQRANILDKCFTAVGHKNPAKIWHYNCLEDELNLIQRESR